MKKTNIQTMSLCALLAALSAVLSQLSIPIGPVPVNLTHVSIFIAVGLLGAKYGTVSQIVFVLLGVVGVPVFSQFTGGLVIVLGPTGGFIIGYIGCAFVAGLIMDRFGRSIVASILAMYAGWSITYLFGISWYMFFSGSSLAVALSLCLFPFLLGDVLKTILSAVLINRVSPVIWRKIGRIV